MPRLLRPALLLLALTGCTAEPACVDGLGRRCVTNTDCDTGDGCREIAGRGFFCAPPDKSGFRVTGSLLQTAVPIAEGKTDGGLVVRGAGFRTLPRAQGRTDSNYIVVEGDLR